jgi:hypothetical protein
LREQVTDSTADSAHLGVLNLREQGSGSVADSAHLGD